MAGCLARIQRVTWLTRERIYYVTSQTLGKSVFEGEKMWKAFGWSEDGANVDVWKRGNSPNSSQEFLVTWESKHWWERNLLIPSVQASFLIFAKLITLLPYTIFRFSQNAFPVLSFSFVKVYLFVNLAFHQTPILVLSPCLYFNYTFFYIDVLDLLLAICRYLSFSYVPKSTVCYITYPKRDEWSSRPLLRKRFWAVAKQTINDWSCYCDFRVTASAEGASPL